MPRGRPDRRRASPAAPAAASSAPSQTECSGKCPVIDPLPPRQITIADIAAAPINGWTLAFAFGGDQRVTGAWNAATAQSGAAVTARDEGWNAVVSPGGTTTFDISGTWHDSDAPPTAFTVNGAPCEVR
ncbi:cellulose binding domain-containing protein [Dactylosporangium sp. NPDC000555]|uniref:cellulose binding domain-containing protein n=1 Tax=Dactylosporangium sp. NPDC000555 TaxID=3154260 RepID=UPI00332B4EE1